MKLSRLGLLLLAVMLLIVGGLLLAARQLSAPPTTISLAPSPDKDDYAAWGLPETRAVPMSDPADPANPIYSAFPSSSIQPMSWSPDGSRMAYQVRHNRQSTIFLANPDGSQPKALTTDDYFNAFPRWSPDGHWIAYVSVRDVTATVYKIRPDGTDQQLIVTDVHSNSMPSWSPDGRWIAVVLIRGGNGDIYRVRADGSNLNRLTFGLEFDGLPLWSPDGQWIAYIAQFESTWKLYRMSIIGDQRQALATIQSPSQQPLTWSPDGGWIAYESRSGDIFRIRYNGTALQQLTFSTSRDSYPRWSPDGEWIAFLATNERGISTLHKMRSDGSQIQEISTEPVGSSPIWSPDHKETGFATANLLFGTAFILSGVVITFRRI